MTSCRLTKKNFEGFLVTTTTDAYSNANIINSEQNPKKTKGTVYDPAGGASIKKWCSVGQHSYRNCTGTSHKIQLNINYIKPNCVQHAKRVLNLICHRCGSVRTTKNIGDEVFFSKKLAKLELSKKQFDDPCRNCKFSDHRKVEMVDGKEGSLMLQLVEKGKKTDDPMDPSKIKQILSKINMDEWVATGMDPFPHPKDFLCDFVIVPPGKMRPLVTYGSGSKNNQFSAMFASIASYRDLTDYTSENYKKLCDLIYNVTYLPGADSTSYMSVIGGKNGWLRERTTAKIITQFARGIIGCDNDLPLGHIGIPVSLAEKLVVEEIVTAGNLERLQKIYINRGFPSIQYIQKNGKVLLNTDPAKHPLEIGMIIKRNLMDDDVVCLNRQPTMNLTGITAMKVVINPNPKELVIKINVIDCALFNADYDGDMLPFYVLSKQEAISEAKDLINPIKNFQNKESNHPMLGQAQDSIYGTAALSQNKHIPKKVAAKFFKCTSFIPKFDKEVYTGNELIAMCLKNINYNGKAAVAKYGKYLDMDTNLIIRDGIIEGIVDGASIKDSYGSIFHIIRNYYGERDAIICIQDLQQVANAYLGYRGFTLHYGDFMVTKKFKEDIDKVLGEILSKYNKLVDKINKNEIIVQGDISPEEYYESLVLKIVNKAKVFDDIIFKHKDFRINTLLQMVIFKSKGKWDNILAMFCSIRQLMFQGKRNYRYLSYGHQNVMSTKYSTDITPGGFCTSSLCTGYDNHEYISTSTQARDNSATKSGITGKSGHLARNLKMTFSGVKSDYRRVQIHTDHNKIQCLYPYGDGYDPSYLKRNESLVCDPEKFDKLISIDKKYPWDKTWDILHDIRDEHLKHFIQSQYYKTNNGDHSISWNHNLPFDLKYYVDLFSGDQVSVQEYMLNVSKVKKFIDDFYLIIRPNYKGKVVESEIYRFKLIEQYLYMYLNPSTLSKMSTENLDLLMLKLSRDFLKAAITQPELLGIIAGTCIGSPLTQYLIDSHHVASGGGTKFETINQAEDQLSSQNKYNNMYIYLKEEYASDKIAVDLLISKLEEIKLNEIVEYGKIIYHHDFDIYPQFKKIVDNFVKMNKFTRVGDIINPYFAFKLKKNKILAKNVDLLQVRIRILQKYYDFKSGNKIEVITNDVNDDEIYLLVYFTNLHYSNISKNELIEIFYNVLDIRICGIENIKTAERRVHVRTLPDRSTKEEYFIVTKGINMFDTCDFEEIDQSKKFCNNCIITQATYGIEVARKMIREQLKYILEDIEVSDGYYDLISRHMTYRGEILDAKPGKIMQANPTEAIAKAIAEGANDAYNKAAFNNTYISKGNPIQMFSAGVLPDHIGDRAYVPYLNKELLKQIRNNTSEADIDSI